MSRNISIASQQWWTRPNDERFLSLEALHQMTLNRANRSQVEIEECEMLKVVGEEKAGGKLSIVSPTFGEMEPTHWAFGQLCSRAHVPAKWAREIAPHYGGPQLASYALNYGLRMLAEKDSLQVMALKDDASGVIDMRCLTGRDYGRIYDHRVVEAVMHVNEQSGNRWHIPSASYAATNPLRATTLYGCDSDVFVFLVDEKNPIIIQADGRERRLHRGFIVSNSEVGKGAFYFMTFLYDFVCDNRTIWGAEQVRELSIRHTSGGPDRFEREAAPMLTKYAETSVVQIEQTMKRAVEMQIGKSDEDVVNWLQAQSFTKKEAQRAVESAHMEEGDARTLWQIINGGTASARAIPHTDDRLVVEKRFSSLLKKVAA